MSAVRPLEGSAVRATFLVVLSACCFGSIAPLTALALEHGAQLQGVQSYRYGTAALLLAIVSLFRGRTRPSPPTASSATSGTRRPWWHPFVMLSAGGPQATVATLALLALRWVPAATAGFLFYTYPAWVAVITAVRGHERLTPLKLVALGIALGGIALMVGAPQGGSLHPMGVLCAMGGALVYAAYIPLLDRISHGREPVDVARAMSTGGFLLFLTWAVTTGALVEGMDRVALACGVAQGVLSSGAFLGFLAGLRTLGPVRTAITSTVEPFWTTVLSAALIAQPVGASTLTGGAAIAAAVVLLQLASRQPKAWRPGE